MEFDQGEELKELQNKLSQIIDHCEGQSSPSLTVKELKKMIDQWRDHFLEILQRIEVKSIRKQVNSQYLNLRLNLQNIQDTVLDSSLNNVSKLELLRDLLDLETRQQQLETRFQGDKNQLTQVKGELQGLEKELEKIQVKLEELFPLSKVD